MSGCGKGKKETEKQAREEHRKCIRMCAISLRKKTIKSFVHSIIATRSYMQLQRSCVAAIPHLYEFFFLHKCIPIGLFRHAYTHSFIRCIQLSISSSNFVNCFRTETRVSILPSNSISIHFTLRYSTRENNREQTISNTQIKRYLKKNRTKVARK